MDKAQILSKFSADPNRYYTVDMFAEHGYERRPCHTCRRFYWSANPDTIHCPDHDPDTYSFIGQPPTSIRLDYTQAWNHIEEFFVSHNHTSIPRYPVVCRWRDDLYYTIASIVDFQRVSGSQVTFQFPANPLIIPQTCLRFKDIENVGVTGRHFSSFCMIGQHSIPDTGGYWKDTCMHLDHTLLTQTFGIPHTEITYVEDVWAGGGSFGPSLEYFVGGLELGNAVFTEFQGTIQDHTTLKHRIIDMGAGLERFAWITMGTPTAYDCCFGPALDGIMESAGADRTHPALKQYYTSVARRLDTMPISELRQMACAEAGISQSVIHPLEISYMVADHIRTLIFAISDGSLPSNVGGGYNLRMMVRRIADSNIDIHDIIEKQIDYLALTYPELDSHRNDVRTIIDIEMGRYHSSKGRMAKVASRIRERHHTITVDELVTLYESDGITPEYLLECGAISHIPDGFATRLADLHQSQKPHKQTKPDTPLPATTPLYYADDPPTFHAKVLAIHHNAIILDRTSFYPRGGGQEPDHGMISDCHIHDVTKYGNTILHHTRDTPPDIGQTIQCAIDTTRRNNITNHHTATHIINAASRQTLGSWVWQHSAHKDQDHARLDITHHSALSAEQTHAIQDAANHIIQSDLPVSIQYMDRGSAESAYGFSIYQGGVVPVDMVRIVSIGDIDVEACGGTHLSRTGALDHITITRAKRIQDGVVRLEFTTNKPDTTTQTTPQHIRADHTDTITKLYQDIPTQSHTTPTISYHMGACVIHDDTYDQKFHTTLAKRLLKAGHTITYCGIFRSGLAIRVMIYCTDDSPHDAYKIAADISDILGGRAAGNRTFAQGGGRLQHIEEAASYAKEAIL